MSDHPLPIHDIAGVRAFLFALTTFDGKLVNGNYLARYAAALLGAYPGQTILPHPAGQVAREVLAERMRQLEVKGYDIAHDDAHPGGEIAACAAFYAMPPAARDWPAEETGYGPTFGEAIYPEGWTVPTTGDRRRELVKAAALLVAEIERIDRAAARELAKQREGAA
jgi:hypothetical protein